MAKIKFVNSRNETSRGWQLNDGRIIAINEVVNGETTLALSFDKPFNLDTGEIYDGKTKRTGKNGMPDDVPEGYTTLNNLKAQGNGHEVYCYDEHYINLGEHPDIGDKEIDAIIAEFKKAGFNVTKAAILHNYYAWILYMKSGYRDEEHGYHLFSPCGGFNKFSLSATTLHPLCADWQKTYKD